MTSPLITALADGSHISLTSVLRLLRRPDQSLVECCDGQSNWSSIYLRRTGSRNAVTPLT